jgi:hypothetical protein
MKSFKRPPSATSTPDVEIDFGNAKNRLPQLLEHGSREVQVQAAKVVAGKNGNISVVLDLLDVKTGARIDNRALWVDGPNANVGTLAAENQELIGRMLELAGKPTAGSVRQLIPEIAGLAFTAVLGVATDTRTGRPYNTLIGVYAVGAA